MISALIGQPPLTENDYYIVKGILRLIGKDADPAKGVLIPPPRPPNYHFESHTPLVIGIYGMCIAVITLVTGTRLLIRALKRGLVWGMDDWAILLALVFNVAWLSGKVSATRYGEGKHTWDLTYYQYDRLVKVNAIIIWFYVPALCLIKISITLFNRRITGLASKTWRRINDVLLSVITMYMFAYTFYVGLRCRNTRVSLVTVGKMEHYKACAKYQAKSISLFAACFQVVLDFCLLSTPIIVLWKIKMARSKKIRPLIIFLIGSVSCVGSLMIPIVQYQKLTDLPWNDVKYSKWILVELTFGFIVASLPVVYGALPPSWQNLEIFTRLSGRSRHSSSPWQPSSKSNHTPKNDFPHPDPDLVSTHSRAATEAKSNNSELELLEHPNKETSHTTETTLV